MKKTLTLIAASLLSLTASCTYNTNSGNNSYSSKGYDVPVVTRTVVRTVVRPVYVEPVVEVRPVVYGSCYARTILPYGVYCH